VNVYGFVGNQPVLFVDLLGLEWSLPLRNYGPRANVTCECGDKVEDLAAMIELDAFDFKEWLKDDDGYGLPDTAIEPIARNDRAFSVPNTAYVDIGHVTRWTPILHLWVQAVARDYVAAFSAARLKVVAGDVNTGASIRTHLNDENLLSYVYVGHGAVGALQPGGIIRPSTLLPSNPAPFTKYGIWSMDLIACNTHDLAYLWDNNVSTAGTLLTVDGSIGPFHRYAFIETPGGNRP